MVVADKARKHVNKRNKVGSQFSDKKYSSTGHFEFILFSTVALDSFLIIKYVLKFRMPKMIDFSIDSF